MAFAISELVWIRSFLASLDIFLSYMTLDCDNQAALHIAPNLVFHERMKRIELICHFIWEKLEVGIVTLSHVNTKHQPTNIFTKALGKAQFNS